MFWFEFPYLDLCQAWKVIAYFSPVDETDENYCITWPEAGTGMVSAILPAGEYICSLELSQIYGDDPVTYTYYASKDGWVSQDEYAFETLTLDSGSMIEIGSAGLEELEELGGLEELEALYG